MNFRTLMLEVPGVLEVRGEAEVLRISEDSRQVKPGDLFVARRGSKASGAVFAADAIQAGAVAIVSEEQLEVPAGVAFGRVSHGNLALGVLAQALAGWPGRSMKLLAVTGTNGKTTITYLVRAILKAAGNKCGLIGTVQIDDGAAVVESEMTTPGAVELAGLLGKMKLNGAGYCVMETSSHALHQERTGGMNFAVGMFTNLTGDHLDYHKTMEAYAAAKAKLFETLAADGAAVINVDDHWAERMAEGCKGRVIKYGLDVGATVSTADWAAKVEEMSSKGMRLAVRGPGGQAFELKTPLVGRYNVYNVLCALAATDAVGIDTAIMIKALDGVSGAPGRLQPVVPPGMKREELKFQVFVDYAHTHDALENVLLALRPLTKGRLICVFGCGGDRDRTKRPKMADVAQRLADRVIVTSDNPRTEDPQQIIREISVGFGPTSKGKCVIEADRRSAIRVAIGNAAAGDVIVIAGKGHENYQIIGKTKQHFDDVEEASGAMAGMLK